MTLHLLYVDPGSGSYLIQALVAAVSGFLLFFKSIRMYLRDKFSRLFGKKKPDE